VSGSELSERVVGCGCWPVTVMSVEASCITTEAADLERTGHPTIR
jgi:hypothetical protein